MSFCVRRFFSAGLFPALFLLALTASGQESKFGLRNAIETRTLPDDADQEFARLEVCDLTSSS